MKHPGYGPDYMLTLPHLWSSGLWRFPNNTNYILTFPHVNSQGPVKVFKLYQIKNTCSLSHTLEIVDLWTMKFSKLYLVQVANPVVFCRRCLRQWKSSRTHSFPCSSGEVWMLYYVKHWLYQSQSMKIILAIGKIFARLTQHLIKSDSTRYNMDHRAGKHDRGLLLYFCLFILIGSRSED